MDSIPTAPLAPSIPGVLTVVVVAPLCALLFTNVLATIYQDVSILYVLHFRNGTSDGQLVYVVVFVRFR